MDYCICPPIDGYLYAELPDPMQVVTFVLQGRWRGRANLRTLHGYVPYNGGGVVFHFDSLLLRGVKPSWYGDDIERGARKAVLDGIYDNYTEAMNNHSIYSQECEWRGPRGMQFTWDDIAEIWVNTRKEKGNQALELLETLAPANIAISTQAPPLMGDDNPCKQPRK